MSINQINDDDIATYLGQKGYTIKKENMMIEEQNLIKKELMMKPYVPKNSLAKPNEFPIYRESKKKTIHSQILWNKKLW